MHIRNAQEIKGLTSPHGETVYELAGTAAGGSAQHSVALITLAEGKASRKHYHPQAEESCIILDGSARVTVGEESAELHAGDCVVIPPQQVHQIANIGTAALRFLAICVPPWKPDDSVYLD